MIRSRKRLAVCSCLLCVNLCFIWGNSLLPGEISGAVSGWLRNLIALLFGGSPDGSDTGHGLLRKLAHFTEFACLGLLFCWLLGMLQRKYWPLWSLLCGAAVAAVDETIQLFVPDRGPAIKDVGIDTLGVCLGIVIIYIIRKQKQSKYLEENKL